MIKRIITGIVLAGLTSFCLFFSTWTRFILICTTLVGLNWEINTLTKSKPYTKIILFCLTISLCYLSTTPLATIIWLNPIIEILCLLILAFILTELFKKTLWGFTTPIIFTIRTACLYLATFPYIFQSMNNPMFGSSIIIALALTDTTAYFIGKKFGSRQLTPLSPKKTIEGAIAGLITTPTALVITNQILKAFPVSPPYLFLLGIMVSFLAQIGDIHESLVKRLFNQKDSSQILPGHGGIYDRIDSYIFSIPITVIILNLWATT